jgi:acyl transferase domain-containing protein
MAAARPPLAIVGVGARLPGSSGPAGFWETLLGEREEIVDTPAYRARTRASEERPPTHRGVQRRGSVGDVEGFDWRAFRMSPRESKYVDPQQRLLLETAWEALEHAGMPFERIAGTHTAVFMGIMWPDYAKLLAENPAQLAAYATSGVGFALAANRISHAFDLRGPSVSLDVQCASSLVAVCLAASSIWSGDAELALAGGVNLILAADSDVMMGRAGILSPSGRCMTFDAGADGFVRGEGAGVIVLKPLACALADRDRVLAVIRGAACNHDGRRAALTAPSHDSQVELVRRACASAGVEPCELDYVELHGTGTQKGDPIEARALGEAVAGRPQGDPCLVGSVKTNIGHCESAAGVASVIKVALALHHGVIPATINHTELHPEIDAGALGVELVTAARPWPARTRPLLAGVNGLSLGGGNAHVVLEQAPAVGASADTRRSTHPGAPIRLDGDASEDGRPPGVRIRPDGSPKGPPVGLDDHEPVGNMPGPPVLVLSARTDSSLRELALAYARHLEGLGDDQAALRATCAAAALRRTHHERRLAVFAHNSAELATALRRFARVAAAGTAVSLPPPRTAPRVELRLSADFDTRALEALRGRLAAWGVAEACTLVRAAGPVCVGEELIAAEPLRSGEPLHPSATSREQLLELAPLTTLQELLAFLYRGGCAVHWPAIYGDCCAAVALPTYRWERERLWIDPLPASVVADGVRSDLARAG